MILDNTGLCFYQRWLKCGLPIAIVTCGIYSGGKYHFVSADQFTNHEVLEIHLLLTSASMLGKPRNHNCKSCAKTCRNLTVYSYCCDYEPMEGLHAVVT